MKKEDILKGNRLIAEYMGKSFQMGCISDYKNRPDDKLPPMKYHNSWAELMPVVIRIGNNFDISISSAGLWVTTISRKDVFEGEISSMGGMTPIENTWVAVVRFLEWYNKQPKYKKK